MASWSQGCRKEMVAEESLANITFLKPPVLDDQGVDDVEGVCAMVADQ